MNLLFLCTLSLLLTHNAFCSNANELRREIDLAISSTNTMTPKKFFKEVFTPDIDAHIICVQSKEIDENLYQKAVDHDLDAMWELAEKTDEAKHVPAVVPMYWLSKLSQRVNEVPVSSSALLQLQSKADQKLEIIAQVSQLTYIKTHEEIESKKRKVEFDRAVSLLAELEKKKRKLHEYPNNKI